MPAATRKPRGSASAVAAAIAVLALGGVAAWWLLRPAPMPVPVPSPLQSTASTPRVGPWVQLRHPAYGVAVEHPADWAVEPGYESEFGAPSRLRGSDGFLGIDAIGGPRSLDEVAQGLANHPLRPYGTTPAIQGATVGGQPARLIIPSADQPEASSGEALVLVRYPAPRTIGDRPYQYFVLYADVAHLRDIAASLTFAAPR